MATSARNRRRSSCLALPIAIGLAFLSAGCGGDKAVIWHEEIIESRLVKAGAITRDEIRTLCGRRERRPRADIGLDDASAFENPRLVFSRIFSALPSCAIVYPSERYYYFQTEIEGQTVWGNLRLTDIEHGRLHCAYYVKEDRRRQRAITITEGPDFSIRPAGSHRWKVSHRGRSVDFVLYSRPLEVGDASVARVAEERVVTGLLDESGYGFVLLFNEESEAFYYVLNPELPTWDVLAPLGESELLVGEQSGFVFFPERDASFEGGERLVLIGVRAGSVQANDYFDGPFDQVPPHLPLKAMLEAAYPYVVYRGGIDAHGRFLELESQRVAISPYQTYIEPTQMIGWLRAQRRATEGGGELIAALTYESKRHFHLRLAEPARPEGMSLFDYARRAVRSPPHVSQGWPANHWGDHSAAWPADHGRADSTRWPANHEAELSQAR